jgi:hypothetical protein
MAFGVWLCETSFETATWQYETYSAEQYGLADFCEKVLGFINFEGEFDGKPKARGIVTQKQLSRKFRRNINTRGGNSLQAALDHLLQEDRIEKDKILTPGSVKETIRWKIREG